ncbi:ATP-binding protein, partial [Segatella copri]
IKAPAASISGFIDLMKDYVDNPQGISCLNSIKGSATHLSQLVAALLDYHQLENGLMKLNPVDFSPADMFRQCAGEMQILSREKGLELHLELDGISNPQTYYHADAFRIRQILNNLVSNAIKYTDEGSVTIQAAISPQHLLTFSVSDTGKGMTTEERQKVFQAFTRLKSAQGIEGTGLGLNITQELVNLLQGTLRLESVKGKGSTFTVTIPLALGTAPAAEEAEEQKPLTPAKPHFENHKILLLDDDPLQLRLLQEMLKKLVGDSWQVFACLHVAEALTVLHNEHPALMMMDIEMPEMNGIRMIQHINHSHMKVVAMTAHDASIIRELKEAGFDDCLFKPFSTEKLKEILGLEDTASEAEDVTEKSNKNSRFAPLLTFAEGDPEAEAEILSTVKQELSSHLQNLQQATEGELSIESIGKTAHKLLPIATMIEMETRQYIAALAPEHISDLSASQIRAYTQAVITDLKALL